MIQGIIQMEDHVINFHMIPDNIVTYTVSNTFSGESETLENIPYALFSAALSCALDLEGESPYKELEEIQPQNPNLRWIP